MHKRGKPGKCTTFQCTWENLRLNVDVFSFLPQSQSVAYVKKKMFCYSLKWCHKLHKMSKNQSVVASVISPPLLSLSDSHGSVDILTVVLAHTLFHLLGVSWVLVGQTVGYLITGHWGPEIQLLAELTASVQPQSTALMILMRLRLAFWIKKKKLN